MQTHGEPRRRAFERRAPPDGPMGRSLGPPGFLGLRANAGDDSQARRVRDQHVQAHVRNERELAG